MALLPTAALWLAFATAGVGNGLIDVFLNVEGQRVESITQRPVLQWLHATYAVGGITGAAVGGLIAATNTDYRFGLVFGAICLFLTAFWNAQSGTRSAALQRWTRFLVPRSAAPRALASRARRAVGVPRRRLDGHVVGLYLRVSSARARGRRRPRSSPSRLRSRSDGSSPGGCCSDSAGGRRSSRGHRRRDRRRDRRAGQRTDRRRGRGSSSWARRSPRRRRPGSDWSRPSRPTIRHTRSRRSPRSATRGSCGARRSSRGSRQAFDLRAAMGVIVCATLGIVVAGALTPRDRPVREAAR